MKGSVRSQLVFVFERGGEFTAELLMDLAPRTVRHVLKLLPLEATVYHTRWCGREIYIPIKSEKIAAPENQTVQTSAGDAVYWREWGNNKVGEQTISVYYGPEIVRDHRGYQPVNVFARVPQSQWKNVEEIGLRVWQRGIERVWIKIKEEPW